MTPQYQEVAKLIDHALLMPNLTDAALDAGCALARRLDVASVCILPHAIGRAAQLLAGSGVQPTTTVGFPHGAHATRAKVHEAQLALEEGATELDMVVNIGKVLGGHYDYVERDIGEVLRVVRASGAKLKVIFENCYLGRAEKIALCGICSELEVDWVKTSTGFGGSGALLEDVRLMRQHTTPGVQVKASGGIRTFDQVLELRALGASRIGSSSTLAILEEGAVRTGWALPSCAQK